MSSIIFRTLAPLIVAIMLVFSVYICLRGHNEPGGGFIGGLIAAASIALLGLALGVPQTRAALRFDPIAIAGAGVLLAAGAGFFSLAAGAPFMTSLWLYLDVGESYIPLSTPLLFDIGVYLTVFGALVSVSLSLQSEREEEDL